jgi:hypothetical protein
MLQTVLSSRGHCFLNNEIPLSEHNFVHRKTIQLFDTVRSSFETNSLKVRLSRKHDNFIVGYSASRMISQPRINLLNVAHIRWLYSMGNLRGNAHQGKRSSCAMLVISKFLVCEQCPSNANKCCFREPTKVLESLSEDVSLNPTWRMARWYSTCRINARDDSEKFLLSADMIAEFCFLPLKLTSFCCLLCTMKMPIYDLENILLCSFFRKYRTNLIYSQGQWFQPGNRSHAQMWVSSEGTLWPLTSGRRFVVWKRLW